ncbi:hypothetical protein A2U01_0016287 [Trifolium medium]|uniref:Uncharacterized protein n=1 Tax=Trifolium medium TaxID=97028 RepID=A0A392N6U1_9FABA|nr:hypothetical protein [Trifolium medium]
MKKTSTVQSKDSVGLASSGSEHEMEEESADLCQNITTRKRKTNTNIRLCRKWSDLPGEGRLHRTLPVSRLHDNKSNLTGGEAMQTMFDTPTAQDIAHVNNA